ncbi:MAG: hypothetical protein LBC22_05415, partial [Endomicrobium sp.]|nr:hypothetical protein [Endomicrobium sp.]
MATDRLVKWSKEAQEFFEKAEDNSVVLDLVISYGCASQTGEGFEELVNSINSPDIKRKVKKVIITDTSYLYRHGIPKFSEYFDHSHPTLWFLDNRNYIEQLSVDTIIKSWAEGIDSNEFVRWHKQIIKDFIGDENGDGVIQDFRDLVLFEANKAASKGSGTLKQCIDFVLEE